MDYVNYIALRAAFALLSALPHGVALFMLRMLTRAVFLLLPRYRAISDKNLTLAFPERDAAFRREVFNKMTLSIARLLLDFIRLKSLDHHWVEQNVEIENPGLLKELIAENGKRGIVFATGHLGSFEILAHSLQLKGFELSYIVRNFKNKRLDTWWNAQRQLNGSVVVPRSGAYKQGLKTLKAGKSLGVLFDQNITRNNAVFVDFFNRTAATTRIIAALALRTNSRVVVTSISFQNEKYKIYLSEPNFSALYSDAAISTQDKERLITQEISDRYQAMITSSPNEWFWMHRRWKTTPEGVAEDFYD